MRGSMVFVAGALGCALAFVATSPKGERVERSAVVASSAPTMPPIHLVGRFTSPGEAAARKTANDECASCHAEIADEWRASLHRRSFVDPSFAKAFAMEPRAFCRDCHAPEADPKMPVSNVAAELGISCVTCHASVGEHLERVEHRALRSLESLRTQGCAECHQFPFPDLAFRRKPAFMQKTLDEHAASAKSNVSCASCHMPLAGADRHRSHAFVASRSAEMIRAALTLDARRPVADRVVITLTPNDVGHDVPTGDLLRRLAIEVTVGDPKKPRLTKVKYLARHFGDEQQIPGVVVRVVKKDDRVGESPFTRVIFDVAADPSEPVFFRVIHQRVQNLSPTDERRAIVAGELVIFEGELCGEGEGTKPTWRRGVAP